MTPAVLLGVAIAAIAAATVLAARHKLARDQARAALQRLWALTGEGVAELALDGTIRRASGELAALLGCSAAGLRGRRLHDLVHPGDQDDLVAALNPLAGDSAAVRTLDARLRHAGGAWHLVRIRARVDAAAGVIALAAREPGEPGGRERAVSIFERTFTTSPFGMAVVAADGVVRRANRSLCELIAGDPAGAHFEDLLCDEDLADAREQLARLIAGELHAVSLRPRLRSGQSVVLSVSLVRDDAGVALEYVVQVEDASERERLAERVRFEAEHDPLTGMLNRRAFAQVLAHHVAYARRYRREAALVIVDVAGLRDINAAYGTAGGDAALEALARLLGERLRETDVVARLGGGEFGVMLAEVDGVAAARIAADLVAAAAARAVDVAGSKLRFSIRAGIALFGEEALTPEELSARADGALAEAKQGRGGGAVTFDGDVRERRAANSSRRTWAEKLRAGLESDAFLLDAQPIVDLAGGEPVMYELLLRLRDDDGAIVRPATFLHAAERYGLMRAIDEWVVRRAIALARARLEASAPVTLSVNVSAESVADHTFLPVVVTELLDAPDVGARLVFELTERTAVADMEQARRLMARLSEFGCRFALDDFGAGAGGFSYLKHLPVDFLKLDGEFTRELPSDAADREIVGAVVAAAHGLGKTVIAECVEDAEILAAVESFGVALAQGLHVGRPERASELLALPL